MAGKRGARASRLLRRARQQQNDPSIPHPGNQALVPGVTAPQPAHPPELGTHGSSCHPMATSCPDHASMAKHAIRRPHPRQEPSALAAHAGICAGGRWQQRSLPRPFRSVGARGCNSPGRPASLRSRSVTSAEPRARSWAHLWSHPHAFVFVHQYSDQRGDASHEREAY